MPNSELKELAIFSRTLKILFIEDNKEVREQILKLLKNFFLYIDVATDGLEGEIFYEKFHNLTNKYYDLVITDLNLPRKNGSEVIKSIKLQNKEQLILIISAHTEIEKIENLNKLEVYDFLQKPLNYIKFVETMKNIIRDIKDKKENDLL